MELLSGLYGFLQNALRLAHAIVQRDFEPIDGELYSESLNKLVTDILNKDQSVRPSAKDILNYECIKNYAM